MSTIPDIEAMTAAYLECAVWAGTYWPGEDEEPVPLDSVLDSSDIPLEVVDAVRVECREFAYANLRDLLATGAGWDQHGHDFHLTRNSHGAGFWDRGYGEVGERLTEACKGYGSRELEFYYVNGEARVEW